MDPKTDKPLDTLTLLAQHQIQELGCHTNNVSEIVDKKDPAVFTAIQEGLERANQHATSRAEKVGMPCWCPEGLNTQKAISLNQYTLYSCWLT